MLTKMVDGKQITCSDQEEAWIRKKWDLNTRFPEYEGHVMFDWASEPNHDLKTAKFHHRKLIESHISNKIAEINSKIEAAEEIGDENERKSLLQVRKSLKDQLGYDDGSWTKIEDLKSHLEGVKNL